MSAIKRPMCGNDWPMNARGWPTSANASRTIGRRLWMPENGRSRHESSGDGKGLPEGAGEQGDPPGLPEGDSKQENAGKAEPEAPDQHQAGISICCGLRQWETLQAVVNCLTGFILRHTMWAALHPTLRRFIDGPIHPEDFN